MKIIQSRIQWVFIAVLMIAMVIGCENDSTLGPGENSGQLRVLLTDAPFPIEDVSEANVTITKVEARNKTEEGYPFITLTKDTNSYNLLDLQNGVTAELANLEVPPGFYDLIRLYVGDAGIVLKNGQTFNLKVPSGAQTGIKIFVPPQIEVEPDLSAELILDFDVGKSFVVQGNPTTPAGINGFIFKPVIQAINATTAGRITGVVSDTNQVALENVNISATKDTLSFSTFSETDGSYTLTALPEGYYTVQAVKEDYQTFEQDSIVVKRGNETTVNITLTPES